MNAIVASACAVILAADTAVILAADTAVGDVQVLERKELPAGLVREELLLPGWDSSDPVPAIAVYPKQQTGLPLVFLFHWFQGGKETMEPWARDLAPRGFFVVAPDLHFHGQRTIEGIFGRSDLPELGREYSVFVHQASIAHSAKDFPVVLQSLSGRSEIDHERVGVGGISMGGSLALVLAWQQQKISAVVSLVGAADGWWDVTKMPPGPEQEQKKRSYSPRVRRLVDSIDPWPRLDRLAPKALLVGNGREDHFIDIESMRRFAAKMKVHYKDSPDRFRFLEEETGHQATEGMRREANAWFIRHLKVPSGP